MINRFIGVTLFSFLSFLSFGQTEKVITVDQSGDVISTNAFIDSGGYSVLVYQFTPRSVLFILLDPNLNEVSRYLVNATKLSIDGFSSTAKEFIVYFDGVANATKMSSYFVAFFKDGRTPIFSNWMDIPDSEQKLFSYSFNDKYFVATKEKKKSSLKIFEVGSVNNLKTMSFQLDQETMDNLEDRTFQENHSWGSFIGGSNLINPYKDSVRLIIPIRKSDLKGLSLDVLTFKMNSASVSTKTFLPNQLNDPDICIVNDNIFVLDRQKGFLNRTSLLTISDLRSYKTIVSYKIDPDSLGFNMKIGPIINRKTGEVWEEEVTVEKLRRFIDYVEGVNVIAAEQYNDSFKLRIGGVKVIQSSVYQGPGQPATPTKPIIIPLIFSLGIDKNLSLIWEDQNDNYINLLKKFQEQKLNKTVKKSDEIYFTSTSDTILGFCFFDKTNQTYIYKVRK